jgi:hypothetical protein
MESFPWMDMVKQLGPLAAVVVFFIWRDWQREICLSLRVEKLEEYHRETLKDLVEKSTSALIQCSECLKWIGHVVDHLVRVCPRMVGKDCEKPEDLPRL